MPKFSDIGAIKAQINRTCQEIENFKDEVESDDLERYPNVYDRLSQLTEAIHGAEDALTSMQNLNVIREVNIDPIIETTEDAITIVNSKSSVEKSSALVVAINALLELQGMLQEISFPSEDSVLKKKVTKTDTDSSTGGRK